MTVLQDAAHAPEHRAPDGAWLSGVRAAAPDGIAPLTVRISEMGVEVGAVEWPSAQANRGPGLNAPAPVHTGTVRELVPLTFAAPPGAGELTVGLTVGYQACSDAARLSASSVTVRVGITELAMVDRTLPSTHDV